MNLRPSKQFFFRLAAALLLFGGLYGLLVAIPSHKRETKQLPNQNLYELRAALDENYIALTGFTQIDSSQPSSAEGLKTLRTQIDDTVQSIDRLSKNVPTSTPGDPIGDTKELVGSQKDLLKSFDNKFNPYEKAILYNPADDIGNLDISSDKAELIARSTATNKALERLSNNVPGGLRIGDANNNDSLKNAVSEMSGCFETLSQQLSDGSPDAVGTRGRCIKDYPQMRAVIISDIVAVFTKDNNPAASSVRSLIERIDSAIRA